MASAVLSRLVSSHRFLLQSSSSSLPRKTQFCTSLFSNGFITGYITSFSNTFLQSTEPVVSVDWLHANLREPDMKVLDASWYMPDEQRNPLQEYQVAHISGALFFDVDGISDRTMNLPRMLPSEEAFAAAVSALGIENKDGLVVYDGTGIFSAARVWWFEEEGISLEPICNFTWHWCNSLCSRIGLHRLGKTDVAVYDGSWTEWGANPDTTVSTSE